MKLGESGDKIKGPLTELVTDIREAKGYIYRRDAADTLGFVAAASVDSLKEAAAGQDPDVKLAAEKALNLVRSRINLPTADLSAIEPRQSGTEQPAELSDDDLIQAAIQGMDVEISGGEGNHTLVISPSEGRKQRLYVKFGIPDHTGVSQVAVFSLCSQDDPKLHKWALETNAKLSYGALAVRDFGDGKKKLVLMDSLLRSDLAPEALRKSIVTVAKNADWIEKHVSLEDAF
ncbi:hypothetical protein ACFL1X_07805 [Candidatus Hydrogenedentota bacterium]